MLDMNWGRRFTRYIYPKDIIFRGEFEIQDYDFIDHIYIAILLPGQVYIVDQYTEQVLSAFTEF
jgi:hypothetical protein